MLCPCVTAPFRINGLHSHFSGFVHGIEQFQDSASEIEIVEGPVSGEQMNVLACIAQSLGVPYSLVYSSHAGSSRGSDQVDSS
jgi:hypothetical protein